MQPTNKKNCFGAILGRCSVCFPVAVFVQFCVHLSLTPPTPIKRNPCSIGFCVVSIFPFKKCIYFQDMKHFVILPVGSHLQRHQGCNLDPEMAYIVPFLFIV